MGLCALKRGGGGCQKSEWATEWGSWVITEGRAPCVPPLFPMMPPDTQFLTLGPPDTQCLLSSLPGVPTPTQEPSAHIFWLLGK